MFLIDVELFTEENEGLELQASSFTNDGLFMIGVVEFERFSFDKRVACDAFELIA